MMTVAALSMEKLSKKPPNDDVEVPTPIRFGVHEWNRPARYTSAVIYSEEDEESMHYSDEPTEEDEVEDWQQPRRSRSHVPQDDRFESMLRASEETEDDEGRQRKQNCWQKLVIGIFLLGFIIYVVIDSFTAGNVRSAIGSFLTWIENNPIPGFFAFMVVYFVATILFVPGSLLTLGSGFVFANAFGLGPGVLIGSLSVFLGASSGAIVAFLLGRYLLREWVQGLTKKYAVFEALDIALEEKGFRIMALLRLSPIIPFNAINYIGGVTAISFYANALALIVIIPGTVLYVFLGASAGSLADSASSGESGPITIIVVVVGCVFGLAAIFLTSYYAKKELNRVIIERETKELMTEEGSGF